MKRSKYIFYTFIALVVASCSKKLEVAIPELSVTPVSTTVKAGETVVFTLGNEKSPDNLFFFSGEPLQQYSNSYGVGKGRLALNSSGYSFSFQSRFDYNGPPTDSVAKYGLQTGQLSMWASTDFNGKLDSASVKSATWTDITDKFTLPTAQHASSFTNSGVNNLTDVLVKGKPLYLAYKLTTKRQRDNGYSQYWNVQNFVIQAKDSVSGQLPILYNMGKMEFNFVDMKWGGRSSILSRTATVVRVGDPNPYITTTQVEDSIIQATGIQVDPSIAEAWAISTKINVDSVFLGYDTPVTIASYTTVKFPTEYSYVYSKPGTYKAVFVGVNRSKDETKNVVKEFTITVMPQ